MGDKGYLEDFDEKEVVQDKAAVFGVGVSTGSGEWQLRRADPAPLSDLK